MKSLVLSLVVFLIVVPARAQIAFPDVAPPPSKGNSTSPTPSQTPPPTAVLTPVQPPAFIPPPSSNPTSPTTGPLQPGSPQLTTPQPPPEPEPSYTLYDQGSFPSGPRLKPQTILKEGGVGSWLIGKFILIDQDDAHHYTIKSHVDSIGIGLIDMTNKAGARPITVHLRIIQPPPGGLSNEFSYGPLTPLKVTRIDPDSNAVWAVDVTRRR